MNKQRILTPPLGQILDSLMKAQRRGERIVSVCPHYFSDKDLSGYIVITEETEESQRKALEDDNSGW